MTHPHLLSIARHYAANPRRWSHHLTFDATSRFYRRLGDDSGAEVWLLTWLPGQGTDLHDHGGSAGAFTVVDGQLTEERLTRNRRSSPHLQPHVLRAGTGQQFGPHYIHRVSNQSSQPAVSIHAYSPALASMTRYELSPDGLQTVDTALAGAQW